MEEYSPSQASTMKPFATTRNILIKNDKARISKEVQAVVQGEVKTFLLAK